MNDTPKTTDMREVLRYLRANGLNCTEAVNWLVTQNDPEQAWQSCERPDWMIRFAWHRGVDIRILAEIACECAHTALRFVPENENRPRLAVETALQWLQGEATIGEVRAARDAVMNANAAAAATAAYADDPAGAYATYAAAHANAAVMNAAAAADTDDGTSTLAYSARAAARAAVIAAAVYAAAAAVYAYAADADAYAARRQANIRLCDIVRSHIAYPSIAI